MWRLHWHFRERVVAEVESQFQRFFTTGQSVRLGAEPLENRGQILFSQLNTYSHSPHITCSLTRRWVCHLQMLLALASTFILGSESRGTRDHILLSQIPDFPFCRLLWLTGLRWRYSTAPPRGKKWRERYITTFIYREGNVFHAIYFYRQHVPKNNEPPQWKRVAERVYEKILFKYPVQLLHVSDTFIFVYVWDIDIFSLGTGFNATSLISLPMYIREVR
jgi:hypothetical protein